VILEFGDPSFEEPPLRIRSRQVTRALVGESRLVPPIQSTEQIGPGGMCQMMVVEGAALEQSIDRPNAGRGTVPHRNRNGAIELHDG
jgi:hypothetical protein